MGLSVTVGLLSFATSPTGRKAQVNVNIFQFMDYPYINVLKDSEGWSAGGGGTLSGDNHALLNADGYPTAAPAGLNVWIATAPAYYNACESFFTGSVTGTTLTVSGSVTGKPLFIGQTVKGTGITAQTRITGGSGTSWTLSNSMSATGSISIKAFVPWVLDWSGSVTGQAGFNNGAAAITQTPSGNVPFSGINRIEYDLASNGGATFTANITGNALTVSGVTGTIFQGMNISGIGIPPYTTITGGSGSSWTMNNTISYTLTGVAVTGAAVALGDEIDISMSISAVSVTPSNFRLYRQDQEALLNAGQISAPHFINFYKQYGRQRWMNWAETNGSMLSNWADRPLMSNFGWIGTVKINLATYAGTCPAPTKNDFVGPTAITGNPSSWVQGMRVQTCFSNCPVTCDFIGTIDNGAGAAGNTLTVSSVISGALRIGLALRKFSPGGFINNCKITAGSGTSWTVDGTAQLIGSQPMLAFSAITGLTLGTAGNTVVTSSNHGFVNGDVVIFPPGEITSSGGVTSIDAGLGSFGGIGGTNFGNFYTVASATTNTFVLSGVDSSGWGSTYVSGGLIQYQLRFKCGLLPFKKIIYKGLSPIFVGGVIDNWYQLDGNGTATMVYDSTLDALILGGSQEGRVGMPLEAIVQMSNEINGPDMWHSMPHFATDDYVLQASTYIKNNLNAPLKWCFELSNEVWNGAPGFSQTQYAMAMGFLKWGITTDNTDALNQWYAWRFYNMMQQVNTQFTGNTRCTRVFGFWVQNPLINGRLHASLTGVPVDPITLSNSLCHDGYIGTTTAFPDAVDIYNYQQGVLTSNSSLVTGALNNLDGALNAFSGGLGPWFGSISGTTLTITSQGAAGNPTSTLPRLGPNTTVSDWGGSGPLAGTFIVSQLTGTPGGVGTYQVNKSQTNAGPQYQMLGSRVEEMRYVFFPFWQNIANTYSIEHCEYEGGWGVLPAFYNNPTSYLGHTLNTQDALSLWTAYQASSQYATTYLSLLNYFKNTTGGKFSSAYCMTAAAPGGQGMYGMVYPNIFGSQTPGKTAGFDVYNAS